MNILRPLSPHFLFISHSSLRRFQSNRFSDKEEFLSAANVLFFYLICLRFSFFFSNPTLQSRAPFLGARPFFWFNKTGLLRGSDLGDCFCREGRPNYRSLALFREYGVPCWGYIGSVYLISQTRVGNGSLSARQSGGATTSAYPCRGGIARTFSYWEEKDPFRQNFWQVHRTVSAG